MRILYAEDEIKIKMIVEDSLKLEKYTVDGCFDGKKALELFRLNDYDLVILDLMMPELSGTEVMKKIREKNKVVPILALTAKGDLESIVSNIDQGFDDYLPKPFKIEELKSRIRALIRRSTSKETVLHVDDLTLDPKLKKVVRAKKEIKLTAKEYAILEYLLRHIGEFKTSAELTDNIWDIATDIDSNVVAAHIKNLKHKIEKDFPKLREIIISERGFGYKIENDK